MAPHQRSSCSACFSVTISRLGQPCHAAGLTRLPRPANAFTGQLAAGDGTTRREFFRKISAPLGTFFVDPAGEGAGVQHGASLAGMVGETHPPAAISCRGNFSVDTQTGRLGLEARHLFHSQLQNERPPAAHRPTLIHADVAGGLRCQTGDESSWHLCSHDIISPHGGRVNRPSPERRGAKAGIEYSLVRFGNASGRRPTLEELAKPAKFNSPNDGSSDRV